MIDRTALRQAYRMDEEACVAQRLDQAAPASAVHGEAQAIAARLIEGARANKPRGLAPSSRLTALAPRKAWR